MLKIGDIVQISTTDQALLDIFCPIEINGSLAEVIAVCTDDRIFIKLENGERFVVAPTMLSFVSEEENFVSASDEDFNNLLMS